MRIETNIFCWLCKRRILTVKVFEFIFILFSCKIYSVPVYAGLQAAYFSIQQSIYLVVGHNELVERRSELRLVILLETLCLQKSVKKKKNLQYLFRYPNSLVFSELTTWVIHIRPRLIFAHLPSRCSVSFRNLSSK